MIFCRHMHACHPAKLFVAAAHLCAPRLLTSRMHLFGCALEQAVAKKPAAAKKVSMLAAQHEVAEGSLRVWRARVQVYPFAPSHTTQLPAGWLSHARVHS